MSDPIPVRRRSLAGSLRASFLTGLVVVLPIGLTIYLIWSVIGWLDGWILPVLPAVLSPADDCSAITSVTAMQCRSAAWAWSSFWCSPPSWAGSPRA